MQLRKLASIMLVLAPAACGQDGQNWYGILHQDNAQVEYETWYHTPGLGEGTFGGDDGISARIVVDGNTVDRAGNYFPPTWNLTGNAMDYAPDFWRDLATQFKQVNPGEHEKEHAWILNLMQTWRDAPRTVPGNQFQQQALTAQQDADLVASQAAGERMVAEYRREHPEYFQEDTLMGSSGHMKNRGFRDQLRMPGYEFHQVLEIWAEHFYVTGWDHSATRAWTYRRPAGSSEAWTSMGKYDACNHGDCPEKGKMQRRQVCDTGAVSDWYVVDGECQGNWLSGHLCNDDTSLQINHAQGIWTGWQCPGHNRGIVPKCGKQW